MNPYFHIQGQNGDITNAIMDRFLSLTLVDQAGYKNDRLVITMDDRLPYIKIPQRGEKIKLRLGYQDKQNHTNPHEVREMGTFVIDEIEWDGPPFELTFTAHSCDTSARFKQPRSKSFHRLTLGEIVKDCAEYSGYTAIVHKDLEAIKVDHEDQVAQSCAEFLKVLGDKYNAIIKIQELRLLFAPKNLLHEVSERLIRTGIEVPLVGLTNVHFLAQGKSRYATVSAYYDEKDSRDAQGIVTVKRTVFDDESGAPPPIADYQINTVYPTKAMALEAARTKSRNLGLSESGINFTTVGNAEIMAESDVTITGCRPGIPNIWRVIRVQHTLDDKGFRTECECQIPGAKAST